MYCRYLQEELQEELQELWEYGGFVMESKERVIIFGTGSGFKKRENQIKQKYNIIAYTDNGGGVHTHMPFISPTEIGQYVYDKILVCSIQFYETIKYQLIFRYGIDEQKILCVTHVIASHVENHLDVEKIIFHTVSEYENKNKDERYVIKDKDMWLICNDLKDSAGGPAEHYFAQDIWAAQKIYQANTDEHYDIGSRLDGFIAHLLVFLKEVHYIDIRPLPYKIAGLQFMQGDATNLETIADNSITSLSSLHAVEHFGLGRYGDPVDPKACFKTIRAFGRVLKRGGVLYFAVPIGPIDRVIFNAHRIFNPLTIISSFEAAGLSLIEFAVVKKDEYTAVKQTLPIMEADIQNIEDYSCGLFEFVKII